MTSPAGLPPTGGGGGERQRLKLLAVTACPTGIAHTYMAAEKLAQAARAARRRHEGGDPGLDRGRKRTV